MSRVATRGASGISPSGTSSIGFKPGAGIASAGGSLSAMPSSDGASGSAAPGSMVSSN
jgi:hypothetical protein